MQSMKNMQNQTYKANLANQTYQTKPIKPNLRNQTYQTKTYQTNPTKPNQTYQTIPTKQTYQYHTKPTKLTYQINPIGGKKAQTRLCYFSGLLCYFFARAHASTFFCILLEKLTYDMGE